MKTYRCGQCMKICGRWYPQCPFCKAWSSLAAAGDVAMTGERASSPSPKQASLFAPQASPPVTPATSASIEEPAEISAAPRVPVPITSVSSEIENRYLTTIEPFDDVLGGGLVLGSVIVLGGSPGCGKSTGTMQAAAAASRWNELRVLYATGEESAAQVAMRARRIDALYDQVFLIAETDVDRVLAHAQELEVDLLVIDSIHTLVCSEVGGGPGSLRQILECTARVCGFAHETDTATILIGHVNKEGGVAGPNTLSHLVDAVLYLEGDEDSPIRILRAHKNRFGSTQVTGRFEMTGKGLVPIPKEPGAIEVVTERPPEEIGTDTPGTWIDGILYADGAPAGAKPAPEGHDHSRGQLNCDACEEAAGASDSLPPELGGQDSDTGTHTPPS